MKGRLGDRIIIDDGISSSDRREMTVPVLPRRDAWRLYGRPLSAWCRHMTTASPRALASSLRERG